MNVTMSKNCFKFLKSDLSFDDPEERKTLWDNNRFAAMREVWKLFNTAFCGVKLRIQSEYRKIQARKKTFFTRPIKALDNKILTFYIRTDKNYRPAK